MRNWLLLLAVAVASCTSQSSRVSKQPVITVNGESLSTKAFADDLARQLRPLDAVSAKNAAIVKRAKEQILSTFVINVITQRWAKDHHLVVSDQDLEAEVGAVRKNYPDDTSFRQVLAEESLSFEQWRERLRETTLEKTVFRDVTKGIEDPSEKEIEEYYKANATDFQRKPAIHLRQIVVAKEDTAVTLLKKAQKENNVAELAKQFSIMAERSAGGDIGWIEKGSVEIFDKLFSQNKGIYKDVIKSPYGYHIVQVLDKRAETQTKLPEALPTVKRRLKSDREQAVYSKWLEDQIKRTKVLRNEALIDSISIETEKN